MNEGVCKDCYFHRPNDDPSMSGSCLFDPPTVFQWGMGHASVRPQVADDDTCHNFKPRRPTKNAVALMQAIAYTAQRGLVDDDLQEPGRGLDDPTNLLYSPMVLIRNLAIGFLGIKETQIDIDNPPELR